MTEAKVIAVVGATGAQGGGLVRAILADPEGGFVPRAITRDPAGEKATGSRRAGSRGRPGRSGRRRESRTGLRRRSRSLLRHQLLGALLGGQGDRPGPQPGPGRQGSRRPARDLVVPRGHAPVRHRRPDADPPGEVQGAPLRREGSRRRPLPRGRRAHDGPPHRFLLGELRLLRARPAARRGRGAAITFPLGTARMPSWRPRTSAKSPTGSSSAATS